MPTLTCHHSGVTVEVKQTAKGNPKLPMGWKWRGGKAFSKEAWHSLYCLRAITVPIVSPVIDEKQNPVAMKAAWVSLDEQLKDAWQKSTRLANYTVKRLWANDVTRSQGESKCPKMPEIAIYQAGEYEGWSQSAGAVVRTVASSYQKKRYEIVWTGSAGVPNVRYPYPFPIHNASWGIEQTEGGEVHFDCRLPAGRVTMRLKTKDKGGKYRLDALRHLIANPELRGESAIIKRTDGTIMVKMVGWFPKTVRVLSGELLVRTSAAHLLSLYNEQDERLLLINGDWIKRKVAGHSAALERWHDDQKLERRVPRKKARASAEDMQAACKKIHNRLKSFIDQTCAQIVGHAVRRGLATVRYDDEDKGYFMSFPWHRMKTQLEVVCNREGIRFEGSSDEPKPRTARNVKKAMEKAQ